MEETPIPGHTQDVSTIHMQSIISAKTKKGLVQIRWPEGSKGAQLTPAKVRHHALGLLECAEAAIRDESFLRYLTTEQDKGGMGLTFHEGIALIAEYREFRGDNTADWRDPEKG